MSIDPLLGKTYDHKKYNCAHFAVDVWRIITGDDISHALGSFLDDPRVRSTPRENRHMFRRSDQPCDPCLVLMRNKRSQPHVGVYHDGRVAQLTEIGAENTTMEVATRGYNYVRFYRCLLS
jgi:hypothetical protein